MPSRFLLAALLAFLSIPSWSLWASPNKEAHDTALREEARLLRACGKLCQGRLDLIPLTQLNALLAWAQKNLSYPQRLRLFSRLYLGAPYRLGPLGEGKQARFDRDPIYRRAPVDCLTYIETVMAYALSSSEKEAIQRLQHIRYKDGKISFATRNHFTGPQWLVENQKRGFVEVMTPQLGKNLIQRYEKRLDEAMWKRHRFWTKRLPPALLPQSYTLDYIRLVDIPRIEAKLPLIGWMGEIFDNPRHPASIAHVGFVVYERGRWYFRHAIGGKRGVRQVPLAAYARWHLRQHATQRPKKIIGFLFARFPDPPPRF